MHQVQLWEKFDATCLPVRQQVADQTTSTEGADIAQHSVHSYLQTRDWMLLQSIALNPGWTLGTHGYEPVPMQIGPHSPYSNLQLAIVMEIVCSTKLKRCPVHVVCGIRKGVICRNSINDGNGSKKIQIPSQNSIVVKKNARPVQQN